MNVALDNLVHNAAKLNIDPDSIVLADDSARAQIAAQVAIITTDPPYAGQIGIAPALKPEQLTAVLLLSGAYDIEAVDFKGDYGWFVKTVLWAYSGTRNFLSDKRFRLVSVTNYVTGAFPPSFISSGNGDPLAPQAVALARKLEKLGVRVESLFFPAGYSPSLPHEYQFNLDTPAGEEALDRMLAFISASVHAAPQVAADLVASELGGTAWQLVKFDGGDGTILTPEDKAKYTFAFEADGRVSVCIDCNRGRGTWQSPGPKQLTFGPLALTRAMCPPGSLDQRIINDWELVRSYTIKEARLFLALMAEGGIHEFEPLAGAH